MMCLCGCDVSDCVMSDGCDGGDVSDCVMGVMGVVQMCDEMCVLSKTLLLSQTNEGRVCDA